MMKLRIKVVDPALTPIRAHPGDAGLDLKTSKNIEIYPRGLVTVSSGVSVEIPHGYVGLVFARSGFGKRYGIGIPNGVGVIDSGYRGEIAVTLTNNGQFPFTAKKYDRIAQLVIVPIVLSDIQIVEELSASERGTGGFGSTGR